MDSCPASLSGKECFIKSSRFKRIDKAVLGRGSYGVVYEGKYGAKDCALKYMYDYFFRESPDASQFKLEEFERECELTRRLSDPHIVQFVGVSFHENVPVLITELLECSLDDVTKCKHCSVPYDKEIDIAVGIAKGLLYLHTHNPPVFHRDLSSKNILLASDYTPKIADLGLAKCIKESSGFTKTAGTPDFMPPEIMETTTPWRLSGAIDLYSYAVVLIQLATRQVLNRLPKNDLVIEGGPAEPRKEEKEKDANDDDENKNDDDENKEGRDAERETEEQNFKGEEKAEEERDAGEESEDEALRYHSRTEYERWRVHIDHMNKDGVLHRIVKCYLKDDPRRREATPLSRVIVWLEEETHSAEYLVEHSSENPGVSLEHRSRSHGGKAKASGSSGWGIFGGLFHKKNEEKKKKKVEDRDSGFHSRSTNTHSPRRRPSRPTEVGDFLLVDKVMVPASETVLAPLRKAVYRGRRFSDALGLARDEGETNEEYRKRILDGM